MSFMRPRKTLQLGFDKQFQPSDEISLGRSGAKRVILCKHEKSGWGIEVLTWSQTPSLLSILWLWHSMDCSYLGISVTAEDIIGWRPEFTTLLSQNLSLTSRQGHSHEKLLGKGQHSLSLGDDSHAHPVWSWSLVTPPIMVSITSCVAPSALVSACIMPSHTSHEGKSHGLRSASARTDGGHWAMCPPQGRTENWLSRCVTLSCLQQSQLPAQAAHCSGRSVLAGLRPPAHHGLGSLSRVYIRDWPGGIKTAIKEELILSNE